MTSLPFFSPHDFHWEGLQHFHARSFDCGYCSRHVSSEKGYEIKNNHHTTHVAGMIAVCPSCQGPTFFTPKNEQIPSKASGELVKNAPADLTKLYEEARRCTSANCHTAAVLICRKLLMNIAVQLGASEGLKFIEYVNFLGDNGHITVKSKPWVDHIRKKGNEATHEITPIGESDAADLVKFIEMILRTIYEYPARISPPNP